MDDLSFLEQAGYQDGTSNGVLWVQLPDGTVSQLTNSICTFKLLDKCPLLYHAFEYGHQSQLQASIEAPSVSAAISLLRYCYTGSYLPFVGEDEEEPIMFLPHAEIYKMAEDFDIPELQLIAHGNFSCQVNFACSLPAPPPDLLETIKFMYRFFSSSQSRQQQDLLPTLLNYCICVFEYHKLGESTDFLQVIQELPEFRQDLCRTNMQRNFEDDCAFDIVNLALDTLQPYTGVRPTLLASRDLPEAMLIDRPDTPRPASVVKQEFGFDSNPIKQEPDLDGDTISLVPLQHTSFASSATTLVHRPKPGHAVVSEDTDTDSMSDVDGFALVHRPRNDLTASPEMVPSTPVDILALTGSHYPEDDDDWTTVDL